MPPSPQSTDRSLLDRLNALKPTGVTLVKSANNAPVPVSKAPPVSREDALAERLRLLRGRQNYDSHDESVPQDLGRQLAAPPPTVEWPAVGGRSAKSKMADQAPLVSPAVQSSQSRGCHKLAHSSLPVTGVDEGENEDSLVDELLDSLGDEDFDLGEDAAFKPTPKSDAGDDAKKVAGLLESLQNPSSGSSASKHDTASSEDDDDSDGEQMARAVETVLSQLGDEINALPPPAALPLEGSIEHLYHPQSPSREPGAENGGDPSNTDGSHEPTLSLPTVPSKLVDPVYDQKDQDTFEKDISARMASLRGLGSLDPLGLPSAPTFRPEDHGPASDTLGKGLLRSSKYTDEDQTTWCVVCLEDATIRCIGCDNDGYCIRCWQEMHVGPSAGYDERGHQWVKFERNHRS